MLLLLTPLALVSTSGFAQGRLQHQVLHADAHGVGFAGMQISDAVAIDRDLAVVPTDEVGIGRGR